MWMCYKDGKDGDLNKKVLHTAVEHWYPYPVVFMDSMHDAEI